MPERYEGPIEGLTAKEQVNVILFRLAEALEYPIANGVITAEPDEILDEAVFSLHRYNARPYTY